ncbi:polysaccharide deacetylase family protein [Meiothermus sp.]|uniref:polysaccharide deacetylase family protein n=1 Tax=Meiothermus sp. TaxID=1955249 RepID=UPI0021DCE02B|nr:polysaccharide deacetylase family protein [Meiothermus sp.]GIW35326.1 MAG: polysaccharide deacetylase familiy protein [Meiothermus sp.]
MDIATLIGSLVVAVLLLYALAEVLGRWMGVGALAWGNRAEPKIALTFDDGPSEQTEAILGLLQKYNLKATFFLTGQQAEQRPDLVEKMASAGHQLEAHGYWHRPAVLMAPWTEWVHIQKSPGKLYRPPWGIHSPFTRLFARVQGKQVVLWDIESQDWLDKPAEQLVQRMMFYIKGGSVVLLHDGPARTLSVLELLLPRLVENGYQPVKLGELPLKPLGPRQGLIRINQGYEERYDRKVGNIKVGYRYNHILRLELQPYPGPDLPEYPKGTPCAHIHFESARLADMTPIQVLRAFRETFKETVQFLEEHPEIRFLFGYSYLGQGALALGFKTHPVPKAMELQSKITTAWFAWLYRGEIARHLFTDPAQVVYISRETILDKYGPKPKAELQ